MKFTAANLALALILVSSSSVTSSLATTPASASTWVCPTRSPGYALQNYRDNESQAQQWHTKYQAATPGSAEQAAALGQLQASSDRALNQIADPNTLLDYNSSELEILAADANQKLNSAPAGSPIQGFYRLATNSSWNAYARNSQYELSCASPTDWRPSVQVGDYATQKSYSSPIGSPSANTYKIVAQNAWQASLQQLQAFGNSAYTSFRELESIGLQFVQRSQASPTGSDSEKFYRQATDVSFNSAITGFRAQIRLVSLNDLYSLSSEYNQKGQQAPFNSPTQLFNFSMRDSAQAEIRARGSNPVPPGNQGIYCTITTPRGVSYYGIAYNQFDAVNLARQACYRYEPYFICNQPAAFCRLQ